MSSDPVLLQQQLELLVYCPTFNSWHFEGAMEDNARPTKRPRLEVSPCSQYQHTPPTEAILEGMEPIDIQSVHSGTDSRAGSSSTCSQDSANCPRLAEIVCFGSITTFSIAKVDRLPCQMALRANDSGQLYRQESTNCGSLAQRDVKLLSLFKNEGVEPDILWIPASEVTAGQSGVLWVTIYGDRRLAKDLGDALHKAEVYLQDPIHAARNTTYWNPQRFHNTEGLRAIDLKPHMQSSYPEVDHVEAVDVLRHFTSEDNLPETRGSELLLTQLKSHQMRALTFMLRREQGWQLDMNEADIWSKGVDEAGNRVYRNNIDSSQHYEHPVPFFGGIIADDMGLGKTLSMISLILHDKSLPRPRGSTLIVVPPSLLLNWEAEIRQHTSPGCLSCFAYYGRGRTQGLSSFSDFDVVFTTYPTLTRDWTTKGEQAFIFKHHWHRVILDEAHLIKNSTATTAKATRALHADRRWVVTATPIQNHISELFSLFQFLRLYPYDGHGAYMSELETPEQATERLKKLLGFAMLRRLNHILALPKRTDTVIPLEFDDQDAEKYDLAKQATIQFLDDIVSSEAVANGYMNAISKINSLRMICNLGSCMNTGDNSLSNSASKGSAAERIHGPSTLTDESSADDGLTGLSSTCTICGNMGSFSPISSSGHVVPNTTPSELDLPSNDDFNRCWSCFADAIGVIATPETSVLQFQQDSQVQFIESAQGYASSSVALPTKIKALINDLKVQRQAIKSIIFSFWKSTLDLAASALRKEGFTYCQIDGKTPAKQRCGILKHFSELKTEAVLLMSLSCGAVGLNLTAASRVYLMEPQWNPAIEEQALARVYRLGQTQPVFTIRFFIKKSIEEYVRGVQTEKRELIDMVLSTGRAKGQNKVTELRNVLSGTVRNSGISSYISDKNDAGESSGEDAANGQIV